jgi:hypothetical protein
LGVVAAVPARILPITSVAFATIRRASEAIVTNWKPFSTIFSAYSGVPLWMPATTLCFLAPARMKSMASTTGFSV